MKWNPLRLICISLNILRAEHLFAALVIWVSPSAGCLFTSCRFLVALQEFLVDSRH